MRLLPCFWAGSLSTLLSVGVMGQSAVGASGEQPGGFEAGGLTPPGSGEENIPPPSTESELARADREDSGRGLEFIWMEGEVGYEYLGLETFSSNDLVDPALIETTQSGLVAGAAAGVRILFLRLGPRFRYGAFGEFNLWTLDGEVGLRIPLGKLEPHLLVSAGYARLGSLDVGAGSEHDALRIHGFNARLGGGLDLYLSNALSIGALVTGDALFLSRRAAADLALPGPGTPDGRAIYRTNGTSAGLAVTASGVIGLHF